MKLILNIFFIFYLVFKPLIPVLDYAVNYNYISEELCINKNIPVLHCNGKCYLEKELAKNAQDDAQSSKTKSQDQKITDLCLPVEISEIQKGYYILTIRDKNIYKENYHYLFLKPIFRPPVF